MTNYVTIIVNNNNRTNAIITKICVRTEKTINNHMIIVKF